MRAASFMIFVCIHAALDNSVHSRALREPFSTDSNPHNVTSIVPTAKLTRFPNNWSFESAVSVNSNSRSRSNHSWTPSRRAKPLSLSTESHKRYLKTSEYSSGAAYHKNFISDYNESGSGSASDSLAWARSAACTSSWQSLFAASNGTIMTTKTYTHAVAMSDYRINGIQSGEAATGPATQATNIRTITSSVRSDEVCCGICNVLHTDIVLYYWPATGMNARCPNSYPSDISIDSKNISDESTSDVISVFSIKKTHSPEPRNYEKGPSLQLGFDLTSSGYLEQNTLSGTILPRTPLMEPSRQKHDPPAARITAPPSTSGILQNHVRQRPVPVGGLYLNDSNPNTQHIPRKNVSFAIGPDGFTFVSPSVYVVISTIYATDKCGTVGGAHTSLTLAFERTQLSIIDTTSNETRPFDVANIPCPQSNGIQGSLKEKPSTLLARTDVRVLLPQSSLKAIDSAWKACSILKAENGYDLLTPLTPAAVMATVTALPMCSDGKPAENGRLYVENTIKSCLEIETGGSGRFPAKQPVFKTRESELILLSQAGNALLAGPGFKIPVGRDNPLAPATTMQAVPAKTTNIPSPQATAFSIVSKSSPPEKSRTTPTILLASTVAISSSISGIQSTAIPAKGLAVLTSDYEITPPEESTIAKISESVDGATGPQPGSASPQKTNVDSGNPQQIIVHGQTISNDAPPITIGDKRTAYSNGHIYVGSSVAPAPRASQPTINLPIVAGGFTLTSAFQSTETRASPSPVILGGLTFYAPATIAPSSQPSIPIDRNPLGPLGNAGGRQHTAELNSKPDPTRIVVGGNAYALVQSDSTMPSDMLLATSNPTRNLLQPEGKSPDKNTFQEKQNSPESAIEPAAGGLKPIVVGDKTYTPVVTSSPFAPGHLNGLKGITAPPGQTQYLESGNMMELVTAGEESLLEKPSTISLKSPSALGEQIFNSNIFSLHGTVLTQGGLPVTISGTRVSLGSSSRLVIGSQTMIIPSSSVFSAGDQTFTPRGDGFSIDGTTLTPGAPAVTIASTKVSLAKGPELVIGSNTIAVPVAPEPTLSAHGMKFTKLSNNRNGFAVEGQTIIPGGPAVAAGGTQISLDSSGYLVIGTSSLPLATVGATEKAADSPLTAGGKTFLAIDSTAVSLDGTRLAIAGPGLTESGTILSLGTLGLAIGSSTYAYPTPVLEILTPISHGPVPGSPGVFTVDGETFTAGPSRSVLYIGGKPLSEGGSPVTVNGTIISLGSSELTVGASTIALDSVSSLHSALQNDVSTTEPIASLLETAAAGFPTSSQTTSKNSSSAGRLEVGIWEISTGAGLLTGMLILNFIM